MENASPGTPLLISFSGVDGSGKSTQIEYLLASLQARGLKTRRLALWDDVVVGAKYRESFVHQIYKSERGVGLPGKPVSRRDKNMRGWHLTLARHFLYLLDAIHLCRVVARERRRQGKCQTRPDVIVFDRYIYDELANLELGNPLSRVFVKLVDRIVPRPGIAYLLDADPTVAYARKPEYPVDFMIHCRQAYFDLAAELGTMTVIPPVGLAETEQAVMAAAEPRLPSTGEGNKRRVRAFFGGLIRP
jgi:thymidylate kinase